MKPGIGLIGRKLGMVQIFRPDGRPVPVTVVEAGPCTVVQAKTLEKDGYKAVQLGFGQKEEKRVSEPVKGHFAKIKIAPMQVLHEFRIPAEIELAVGATVTVDIFKPGDRLDVTGTSKGKGFQGGVKRWHWKGGPQTHGSMSHRAPGSIGSSTDPSRVFKGHHLPGRMGGERVTTQALELVEVDAAQHLLLIRGTLPGYDSAIVYIRKSRKPARAPGVIHQPAKKKSAAAAAAKAGAAAKASADKKAPAGGGKK